MYQTSERPFLLLRTKQKYSYVKKTKLTSSLRIKLLNDLRNCETKRVWTSHPSFVNEHKDDPN